MRNSSLRFVAYSSLTIVGLLATIIPASLPGIVSTYSLSFTTAGSLFLMSFAGFFIGVIAGGILSDLTGRKLIYRLGMAFSTAGPLGTGFSPNTACLFIAVFIIGLGSGILEGGANALILDVSKGRPGQSLNFLHSFFGIGALVGPFIAGGLISAGYTWRLAFLGEGLLAGCLLTFTLFLEFPALSTRDRPGVKSLSSLLNKPKIISCMAVMFLYVASEMGISSWIPMYMQSYHKASPVFASMVLSFFWAALVIGRFLAGWIAGKIKYWNLILISAIGSLLTMAAGITFSTLCPSAVALILTGLFFAAIFPTVLAVAAEAYPRFAATASGLLIGAGGVGGIAFPFFIGVLSDYLGLRAAIMSACLPVSGIVVLMIFLNFSSQRSKDMI